MSDVTIPVESCGEAEVRRSECCGEKYVFCRKYKCGINPKGTTCEHCKAEGEAFWQRIRQPSPCRPCRERKADASGIA